MMLELFKKKAKAQDPPLPDTLPPEQPASAGMGAPQPPSPELPEPPHLPDVPEMEVPLPDVPSTHDQIPNDIEVKNDELSPQSLPEVELPEPPAQPQQAAPMPHESLPPHVESKELPDIPDVHSPPKPEPEEDVPKPPAIFSEEGFYETPEEVRHLVKEDNAKKYQFESQPAHEPVEKPEIPKPQGPLFVDVESFRHMLADMDEIRNTLKSSSEVMQSLNDIKNSKDKELERWRMSLEDLQKKINYVDSVLLKEA